MPILPALCNDTLLKLDFKRVLIYTLDMIRCVGCREQKSPNNFYWKDKARTRKQEYCKSCKSKYNKTWYEKNKEAHVKTVKANNDIYRERNYAIIAEAKNVPCADCYQIFKPWKMEFDHLSDKSFDVSYALTFSEKTLREEIEKCEIVCKHCHSDRTRHRRVHASVLPVYDAWSVFDDISECKLCLRNGPAS